MEIDQVQAAADRYKEALKEIKKAKPKDKNNVRSRALKRLDEAVGVTEAFESQEKAQNNTASQ